MCRRQLRGGLGKGGCKYHGNLSEVSESYRQIEREEIAQCIKNNKTGGCDGIMGELLKKFSRRHNNIFNKYGKCLKQHIVDGICRPLCVLPGLTKYITVRNS